MQKKTLLSISSLIYLSVSAFQVSNAASHDSNSRQAEEDRVLGLAIGESEQAESESNQQTLQAEEDRVLGLAIGESEQAAAQSAQQAEAELVANTELATVLSLSEQEAILAKEAQIRQATAALEELSELVKLGCVLL